MRAHQRSCRTGILTFPRCDEDDDNEEDADEFIEQSSALGGAAKGFRLNFAPGIRNLFPRLQAAAVVGTDRLEKLQQEGKSVKYFLSLHCNFYKTTAHYVITDPPVVFNSGACTLLPTSDIQSQIEIIYINLLNKVTISRHLFFKNIL